MALDGYDRENPEVVDQIATEACLHGYREQEAVTVLLRKILPLSIRH